MSRLEKSGNKAHEGDPCKSEGEQRRKILLGGSGEAVADTGIDGEGHAKVGEVFEGEGDEDTDVIGAAVIADAEASGGDPTGEVAVDLVDLVFEGTGDEIVLFVGADRPVIVDAIVGTEGEESAIGELVIAVDVAFADGEAEVFIDEEIEIGIDFGEAGVEEGDLGIDDEGDPREGDPAEAVEEIGESAGIGGDGEATEVWAIDIDIEEGIEFEPIERVIIATGLEAITHPEAEDRPIAEGIDGIELGEVDGRELGGAVDAIELEDIFGIFIGVNERGVDVGLEDMAEAIEAPGAGLDAFEGFGEFEGGFDACGHGGAEEGTATVEELLGGVGCGGVEGGAIEGRGIGSILIEAAIIIVSASETDFWDYGEEAEVSAWVTDLVIGIGAKGFVVIEAGIGGKNSPEEARAGVAIVEEGGFKEGLAFDIEGEFGEALRAVEVVVDLLAVEEIDAVIFVPLGEGDEIVGVGVAAKFFLVEVLEEARVAEFVDIDRRINVFGEVGAILESDAVAIWGDGFAAEGGFVGAWGGVADVVGEEAAPVAIVSGIWVGIFAGFFGDESAGAVFGAAPAGFEARAHAAIGVEIGAPFAGDLVIDGESGFAEEGGAPDGLVGGKDAETGVLVEGLVEVGVIKDGNASDVDADIGEDHAIFGINADGFGLEMVIGLGGIAGGEDPIFDEVSVGAEGGEAIAPEAEGEGFALEIGGAKDFRFEVIEGAFGGEEATFAVEANITGEEDVAGIGMILSVVAINLGFAVTNDDILFGDGDAVFDAGGFGSDLDGAIAEAA